MAKYIPKKRPGFMIYHEDLSLMANLGAEEFKTVLLTLLTYSRALVEETACELPEMTGWSAAIMEVMKQKLDRDHAEYADKCARNASFRRKGTQVDERQPQSTNSNSSSTSNSSSIRSASAAGAQQQAPDAPEASPGAPQNAPPSLAEVTDYCRENALKVDPLRFVSFYGAKGWVVGSEPMKDWRAALVTWDSRERAAAQPAPAAPVKQVEQQQYTQRPYTNSEAEIDRMMAEFLAGHTEP